MGEIDFVVIDFETTGLHLNALPVEVGMVKVKDGVISDTFDSLIYQEWVSPEASRIHGLSPKDLNSAPATEDLIGKFAEFVEDLPVVMHNAAFDLRIAKTSGISDEMTSNKVYCSLHLSRASVDSPNHKLATLARELQLSSQPDHRALSDAMTTAELVLELLRNHRFNSLHNFYVNLGLWPGLLEAGSYKLPRGSLQQNSHMTASIRESIRESLTDEERIPHPEWLGKQVCFTGILESMPRSEAQRWATRLGAEPRMSLNKNVQFVIVGEGRGASKLEKLREWRAKGSNILEIDEEQFIGFIEEAKDMKSQGKGLQ